MTEIEVVETRRMPDGTEYRAEIMRDDDAQEPSDNDGDWPILRVSNVRWSDYEAEAFNRQAEPYVAKFNELFDRLRGLRNWERFARIFLGSTRVVEYGFNRGTDYAYIAFDTPEWREAVGAPEDVSGEDPLSEVRAWIEGDVWGVRVTKRWNPDEDKDDEDWEPTDLSVWGYYGKDYAVESAKESLAACVSQHKVVHRYTEHEKIAPHQREIDAILEFLETADSDNYCLAQIFDGSDRHLQRVPESRHQRVVFEHFGISYNKIEQERELMFQRLRDDATKEATD